MPITINPEQYYRARNPALREIASASTLAKWRSMDTGPSYSKSGGTVLYKGADLLSWLESNRVETAAA